LNEINIDPSSDSFSAELYQVFRKLSELRVNVKFLSVTENDFTVTTVILLGRYKYHILTLWHCCRMSTAIIKQSILCQTGLSRHL